MATKLDTEKPIFLGTTAVREGSVVDNIRQAVRDLDKGEGVSYSDLEKHLLDNFSPAKSQSYGPSYIKSYVRDGLLKYKHLSHEDIGAEYEAIQPAPKKEKAPKKPTKAQQAQGQYLGFIRDAGEIADASDLDSTQITLEDVVSGTNRKMKTVKSNIAKLEEAGLVRTEDRDGNEEGDTITYIFLTEAGLERLGEMEPNASEDSDEA